MKYSKEKEKEYYNQKLIKDGFNHEMKEIGNNIRTGNFKFSWRNFSISCIGTILGMTVPDIIGTETLIPNRGVRFCVDCLIIVIAISLVNLIFMGISKFSKPKTN